jgi:hypothetical protein
LSLSLQPLLYHCSSLIRANVTLGCEILFLLCCCCCCFFLFRASFSLTLHPHCILFWVLLFRLHTEGIEKYCASLLVEEGTGLVWGGHSEIVALADVLGRPIIVYQANSMAFCSVLLLLASDVLTCFFLL